eukprot:11951008-Alexandrium_andersonii.AAC.1
MATMSKNTSCGGGMCSIWGGKRTSACRPSSGAPSSGHAAALPASTARCDEGGRQPSTLLPCAQPSYGGLRHSTPERA